jgi:hypothetical protein
MTFGKVRSNLPLLASQGMVLLYHIHPILPVLLLHPIGFQKEHEIILFVE